MAQSAPHGLKSTTKRTSTKPVTAAIKSTVGNEYNRKSNRQKKNNKNTNTKTPTLTTNNRKRGQKRKHSSLVYSDQSDESDSDLNYHVKLVNGQRQWRSKRLVENDKNKKSQT